MARSTLIDMKKESWARGERIAAWTLGIAVVAIVVSFFVPEVRQFLHLEKPAKAARTEVTPPATTTGTASQPIPSTQNNEPSKQEPPKPEQSKTKKAQGTTQKTTTKVKGNDNVAGNNNVTGNGNQAAPSAVAPNGIAITGGSVQNPTVNNFAPTPPHVTWKMTNNEKGVIVSINSDKMFSNAMFTVTCDSPCKYASMNMGVYAMMSTERQVNDRTWEFGLGQFNPAGTLEIQFSGDAGFKITDVATRF